MPEKKEKHDEKNEVGVRRASGRATTKKSTKASGKAKSKVRQLPLPKRIWYKPWTWWRNVPAPPRSPLPKARHIARESRKLLYSNKRLFIGIALLYGFLNLLLVRGLSVGSEVATFKALLDSFLQGTFGKIESVLQSFTYLITSSGGGATSLSSSSQITLLVLSSLAFIWALRQTIAHHRPRVRDSFYQGMYPLVPFLLVLLIISFQLLPFIIAGNVYSLLVNNGIVTDAGQKLLVASPLILLGLWSLRMVTASIFGLYIVTLPNMTPFKALRSARLLVYKRRLLIWRKLIMLPLSLLFFAALIEIPLIIFVTPLAEWVFFFLSMAALAFIHSYLYTLYRKLL